MKWVFSIMFRLRLGSSPLFSVLVTFIGWSSVCIGGTGTSSCSWSVAVPVVVVGGAEVDGITWV